MPSGPRARPGAGPSTAPAASGGEPDDARLALAAQADPLAFAALYERYLDRVYRYCYLRLGHREAAEDATSEVFLKALAGLNGFRGPVFAAWLFRITRHVVADVHRRRRPTTGLEAAAGQPDATATPEARAVARAEHEALLDALATLPADQRTVLELQLAGWTGEQVAAALGRSLGAVKMLRLRAVARLRQRLRPTAAVPDAMEAHDA